MTQADASRTSKPIATAPTAETPRGAKKASAKKAAAEAVKAQEAQEAQTTGAKKAASKKVKASAPAVDKVASRVAAKKVVRDEPVHATDRIRVEQSGVHGKGVFATALITKGERIVEYKGEVISWPEALRRHPHDPSQPNHTFYFHVDDETVIDGNVDGNDSKWINHACQPNCEAEDDGGRIFIDALRNIKAGEELFFDYRLVIDEPYTKKLKKEYECRCGFPKCRHTMLGPK
jgi:SET domain-containing protein